MKIYKRKKINLPKFSKPNNYYDRRFDTKLIKSKESNYFYSFRSNNTINSEKICNNNNNYSNANSNLNSPSKFNSYYNFEIQRLNKYPIQINNNNKKFY